MTQNLFSKQASTKEILKPYEELVFGSRNRQNMGLHRSVSSHLLDKHKRTKGEGMHALSTFKQAAASDKDYAVKSGDLIQKGLQSKGTVVLRANSNTSKCEMSLAPESWSVHESVTEKKAEQKPAKVNKSLKKLIRNAVARY